MAASAFLDSYCTKNDTPEDMDLEKGLTCLRLAVNESRRLINGLRALTLDEMGLGRSIQQLLDEQAELAGWNDISFEHNTLDRRYGVELETAVYRIAQEALSNARKHASTDRLSIQLNETKSDHGSQLLTLTVQDWGNGFEPSGVTTTYGHVGLQSMLERTRLLKGEFRTESTPGAGAIVSAIFDVGQ
jgi:signal transduction histidine kinase